MEFHYKIFHISQALASRERGRGGAIYLDFLIIANINRTALESFDLNNFCPIFPIYYTSSQIQSVRVFHFQTKSDQFGQTKRTFASIHNLDIYLVRVKKTTTPQIASVKSLRIVDISLQRYPELCISKFNKDSCGIFVN